MTAEVIEYIDGLRTVGGSKTIFWAETRQITARLNWLGIQDAPRKRRASSRKILSLGQEQSLLL